jgi:hypothetical protein
MSALQLPTPADRASARPRHLRLVEAPPSSLAPRGPLQAWRRRLGVLVVLAALVVIAAQAFVGPDAEVTATVPVTAATVVVEPGQTLWEVAVQHAPEDVGTRAYVEQLAELNGVEASQLDAWQVLLLPTS